MSLDLAVARALHLTRVLERAVHERVGWTIEVGGLVLPATRVVLPDAVLFRTGLPLLPVRAECVSLHHHGVPQLVQPFSYDETAGEIEFELRLAAPVGVGE